jgi:hypothetical protein
LVSACFGLAHHFNHQDFEFDGSRLTSGFSQTRPFGLNDSRKRFRSLLVIARNSSFLYRDRAIDVRRIGSELGARYLVEGSVRRLNDRVRITAQLIDAIHGNHLWSEKFDRSIEDLFDVQDEVTQTIVATITGRIEGFRYRPHSPVIVTMRDRVLSRVAAPGTVEPGRSSRHCWGDRPKFSARSYGQNG